jgi:Domain of unknown function (DUF6916)
VTEQLARAASVTRRTLLKTSGIGALSMTIPGAALARRRRLHSHLRRSSYHGLIGTNFSVEGSRVKLKLVGVRDLNRHQAGSDHAFALVFHGPADAPSYAHTVPELHHPELGRFQLLVSPGRPEPNRRSYSAVINRLHG